MSTPPPHRGTQPEPGWVPAACTLPTTEQPLRVAEFDQLFAASLRCVARPAPTLLLLLDRSAEAATADLTARKSDCCTFFTFTRTQDAAAPDLTRLDLAVPEQHLGVLDALENHARTIARPAP